MNLKIVWTYLWKMLVDCNFKIAFEGQPLAFIDGHGTEDKNRLLRIVEIIAGIAGFVEVDEDHTEDHTTMN